MIKEINGKHWYCCPYCYEKHGRVKLLLRLGDHPEIHDAYPYCKGCKQEIKMEYPEPLSR